MELQPYPISTCTDNLYTQQCLPPQYYLPLLILLIITAVMSYRIAKQLIKLHKPTR